MRFVNPLDEQVLHSVMNQFKKIITVEDLGIPDYFVEHGSQQELWHECGYDVAGIEQAIVQALEG